MSEDILGKFGEKIVSQILDRYYMWIPKEVFEGLKNPTRQEFNEVFESLSEEGKRKLIRYIIGHMESVVFDFLGFFEENTEFKIIHEKDGVQVDLNKLSEMLKAEPIIIGGWIEKFSKYKSSLPT